MQKTAFSRILREEIIRAIVFTIALCGILSVSTLGIAYAANGGLFGQVLNRILTGNPNGDPVTGRTWDNLGTSGGIVYNASKLNNQPSSYYQKISIPTGPQCSGANSCLYGIDSNGNPLCR